MILKKYKHYRNVPWQPKYFVPSRLYFKHRAGNEEEAIHSGLTLEGKAWGGGAPPGRAGKHRSHEGVKMYVFRSLRKPASRRWKTIQQKLVKDDDICIIGLLSELDVDRLFCLLLKGSFHEKSSKVMRLLHSQIKGKQNFSITFSTVSHHGWPTEPTLNRMGGGVLNYIIGLQNP